MSANTVKVVYTGSLPFASHLRGSAPRGVPVDMDRSEAEMKCLQKKVWRYFDAKAAAAEIRAEYSGVSAAGADALASAGINLALLESMDLEDIEAIDGIGPATVAAIGRAREEHPAEADDAVEDETPVPTESEES